MTQTCSVCNHPRRDEIESDRLRGVPYRDVEAKYGVGRESIRRHEEAGHVQEKVQRALAERTDLSAQHLVEISADGLTYLTEAIQACRTTGDHRTLISALRELREYVPFMQNMLGLSGGSSGGYINDPEWQTIRLLLVEIAKEYPQVRPKVIELIGDADGVEA